MIVLVFFLSTQFEKVIYVERLFMSNHSGLSWGTRWKKIKIFFKLRYQNLVSLGAASCAKNSYSVEAA
jgi:hypothetical protein